MQMIDIPEMQVRLEVIQYEVTEWTRAVSLKMW